MIRRVIAARRGARSDDSLAKFHDRDDRCRVPAALHTVADFPVNTRTNRGTAIAIPAQYPNWWSGPLPPHMKLPYRILVLDDDEHALSGIVELLRDAGHHVTGAATYDAAKRLLAVSPFDLLVSDVRLRSFNGLHLVMQTRADHPETAVIIITGYDDPLIELEAHRYNAELVRKPIRPVEFQQRVNDASRRCAGSAAGRASGSSAGSA